VVRREIYLEARVGTKLSPKEEADSERSQAKGSLGAHLRELLGVWGCGCDRRRERVCGMEPP
jgi:hypothetical protein